MKKSKILSLILCAILVIAFASFDASAAQQMKAITCTGDISTTTGNWTIVTPDANDEKQDDYYVVNSGSSYATECKPDSWVVGDTFMSFDFKLIDDAYLYIYTVPKKSETNGSTYKQMDLIKISSTGITEHNATSILGTSNSGSPETFVTADKIRQGNWNSLQMEVCAATGSINLWLNGEKYEIPTQQIYTTEGVECDLKHGFSSVRIDCRNVNENEVFLDNVYIQCGVADAVSPYEDAFRETNSETGYHNGHLGTVDEYMLDTTNLPTITSAYGLDKIVDETILGNKKPDGTDYSVQLLGDSEYDRIYAPKGETVAEITENIVTEPADAKASFRFYADKNLNTRVTDVLPEICYAAVPVYDGGERLRIYNIDKEVSAGLFEHGGFKYNGTNLYYSILGFNPTMTLDEIEAKLDDSTVVIPRTIGVNTVEGIAANAFGSNSPSGTFYPELDFDFSALTKQYFGAYCFAGSGITSVDLSDEGGADSYLFGNAFEGCNKLTSVKMGKGFRGSGVYTFKNCTALKTVDATSLSNYDWGGSRNQFYGCTALEEVKLGSTLRGYLQSEFLTGANYLQKITIKDGGTLDTNYSLFAAAYDESGKMIGISVPKKVEDTNDFKTLEIPQGASVKLFQLKNDGSLVPAVTATSIK